MPEHIPRVLAALDRSTTPCGAGQLICIDGLSAAGKTTATAHLADALAARGTTVRVLHTDAMLHGWDGLPTLAATLTALVTALAEGRSGTWRAWDWHRDQWGPTHLEPPLEAGEVLVLEGVGAAAGPHRHHAAVQVWMETAPARQAERWAARSDDLDRLTAWQGAEQELHQVWDTAAHADLRLS